MARMSATERARLPNSAFAYVDARGRRRLPIHDEAHVRNALGRFERVAFESDIARERTRTRLLRAARRYGIVPVGFITGQIQAERRTPTSVSSLPTGAVTFLMTDIEGSTELLHALGDGYAAVLAEGPTPGRRRHTVRRANFCEETRDERAARRGGDSARRLGRAAPREERQRARRCPSRSRRNQPSTSGSRSLPRIRSIVSR